MSDWRKSAACAGYDPALWFPGNIDFLPVLKHRDSGIVVVPVVRVSVKGFLPAGLLPSRSG